MTFEQFLAEQLGNVPHRHRSAAIWENVRAGVEGAEGALIACSIFADFDERWGRERTEDFELKLDGQVTDSQLRRLALAYYEPRGWRVDKDSLNFETNFDLVREAEGGKERLQVCMTNESHIPHLHYFGTPEIYPSLQVTCTLTK